MVVHSNLNIFSSTFFLTNTYRLSFKPKYKTYFYSFFLLACSSTLHHAYPEIKLLEYIDKAAVYNVIYQGWKPFYKFLHKDYRNIYSSQSIINISSFVSVLWLYGYGYYTSSYSFDTNGFGYVYHAILHALSSIGHHSIISVCT